MGSVQIYKIPGAAGETALAACFQIRREVFCVEQRVDPALEWDGLDPACDHFLAVDDRGPVGTARTRLYAPTIGKIERVAVLATARRSGIGAALMARALHHLRTQGLARVILNAQTAVERFYAGLGFAAEGPEFMEAGIAHVRMAQNLE
jgi:predicted GNAT family N-acyltransferase